MCCECVILLTRVFLCVWHMCIIMYIEFCLIFFAHSFNNQIKNLLLKRQTEAVIDNKQHLLTLFANVYESNTAKGTNFRITFMFYRVCACFVLYSTCARFELMKSPEATLCG